MFGFGRKAAISRRAEGLGRTLHHLVGCIQSQSFDEFIEAMGRKGFEQSYADHGEGLSLGDKSFGFFEVGPHAGEFTFHAKFPRIGRPMLLVEGHEQYLGLVITGSQLDEGIFADIGETTRALDEVGRDARALQAALVRLPGFESMQSLMKLMSSDV